jgi:hypothetical protein
VANTAILGFVVVRKPVAVCRRGANSVKVTIVERQIKGIPEASSFVHVGPLGLNLDTYRFEWAKFFKHVDSARASEWVKDARITIQ